LALDVRLVLDLIWVTGLSSNIGVGC
jgi:hypothetical protein